jgi:hypothetical protein
MSRVGFLSANRYPWGAADRAAVVAVVLAVLSGCTPTTSGPLLTDPHEIMLKAIRTTAALSTVRIHADISVSMAGFDAGVAGDMRMSFDADVDVAHRQMAGRATTQIPGLGQAGQGVQVAEFISLTNASFSRQGGNGRWTKFSTGGGAGPGGPINEQIATMVEKLLSDPSVRLDRVDTASCSLGTCYHVIATVDGQAAALTLAAALGAPGNTGGIAIPPLTFDLMIDQATGVLSEVRFQTSIQGTSVQMLAVFSNPDAVITIAAPPPAIVYDINSNPGDRREVTMTPEPLGPAPTAAQPAASP